MLNVDLSENLTLPQYQVESNFIFSTTCVITREKYNKYNNIYKYIHNYYIITKIHIYDLNKSFTIVIITPKLIVALENNFQIPKYDACPLILSL